MYKRIFTKLNILIIFLLLFFSFLGIYLFKKAHEVENLVDIPAVSNEVHYENITELKKQNNYTPPSEENIRRSLSKLSEEKTE